MSLIIVKTDVIGLKIIEILYFGIDPERRSRERLTGDKLLYKRNVAVVNMGVGNYVNKLSYLHIADLCKHMKKNAVLNDIPVVGGQNVLTALIENSVENKLSVFALRDVECH